MSAPLLSVCLITYNHKEYIQQAIEGVLMQKINFSWEFIIADDYSKDGTRDILFEYKQKYPELIHIIPREKNVGAVKNWMELLAAAKGKYIAYFEGDDYWTDPDKLQMQVDFLEANPEYAISSHKTIVRNSNDKYYPYSNITAGQQNSLHHTFTLVDYLQNHFIHSSSLVFRRSMLKPLPGWIVTAFAGDGFLILLLSLEGKIHYIDKPMSIYRHNDKSVSNYFSRVDINKNFEKHFRFFDAHSNYKFSKHINDKIFSLSFNLNFYNTNYLQKLKFFSGNILKIFTINKRILPKWARYKFLLPAQILKSQIDVKQKKTIILNNNI